MFVVSTLNRYFHPTTRYLYLKYVVYDGNLLYTILIIFSGRIIPDDNPRAGVGVWVGVRVVRVRVGFRDVTVALIMGLVEYLVFNLAFSRVHVLGMPGHSPEYSEGPQQCRYVPAQYTCTTEGTGAIANSAGTGTNDVLICPQ